MQTIRSKWKRLMHIACLALFFFNCLPAASQIPSVTMVRNLSFGAFSQGSSGGTVIISNSGSRSATGDIVPLSPGNTAIFDVAAPIGTVISTLNVMDTILKGSNGGSMSLHIDILNTDSLLPFTTVSTITGVKVGGTLRVGNLVQNPPGAYSGTYSITFNDEKTKSK